MLEANDGCTLAKARENEAVDDVATMGAKELSPTSLNANLAWGSPSSVYDGQAPFSGLRGNSWEYCEDWFAALPGLRDPSLCTRTLARPASTASTR